MRTIKDILICEAIKEPHLRELEQQCKMRGTNFSAITKKLSYSGFNWDKITSKDVYVTTDPDRAVKLVRQLKTGRVKDFRSNRVLVLGHQEDIYKFVYSPLNGMIVEFSTSSYSRDQIISDTTYTATELYSKFSECDEIVFLDFTDLMVDDLRNQRNDARKDAWMLDDKDHKSKHLGKGVLGQSAGGIEGIDSFYGSDDAGKFYKMCAKMARQNRERYENLLAERKASNVDTSKIDKYVDRAYELSEKATKAYMEVLKNSSKYSNLESQIYYIKSNYMRVTESLHTLLSMYADVLGNLPKLKDNSIRYNHTSTARLALEEINKKISQFEEGMNKFENYYNDLLAKINELK